MISNGFSQSEHNHGYASKKELRAKKEQVMVEHFCKDFKWARTYHKFDHL